VRTGKARSIGKEYLFKSLAKKRFEKPPERPFIVKLTPV
jgi:hypothetical protein